MPADHAQAVRADRAARAARAAFEASTDCVDTQLHNCLTEPGVDAAIAAIANPIGRQMLILVRTGEQSSSALAKATGLTRPAASQHLRVLKDAGLVTVRTDRGYRYYRPHRERLAALRACLEDFWVGPIVMLKEAAEQQHRAATEQP